MDRVQSLIKQEIAQIIDEDLTDPNLPEFLTVGRVKVSRDLSECLVFVSTVTDQTVEERKAIEESLNRAAGHIRKLVSQRIELRRHPRLKFRYNDSARYAVEIDQVLKQIEIPPEEEE
jgi:ribosome-binding factor A